MHGIFIVFAFCVGGVLAFFIFRFNIKAGISFLEDKLKDKEGEVEAIRNECSIEREKKIILETKLENMEKVFEEKKKLLDDATSKLADSFQALSKEALSSNNKMFLDLAKTQLKSVTVDMKGVFNKKYESIDQIVKPLSASLEKYDKELHRLEENRQKGHGNLESQIKNLMNTQQDLQKETNNLVSALRTPHVRGRWGEITLKRVVELAGMTEHVDFYEQESVDNGDARVLRPDMIIRLPNNRIIVVDSKVPLQAYLDGLSADNEKDRAICMQRHVKHISRHMESLSKKAYWAQFKEETPDFVVLFIPGESFFSAALAVDEYLMEQGFQKRVILANPTTLITILKSVAHTWRQEQITQNALRIQELGNEIYDRVGIFVENFNKIGKSLGGAVDAYNSSVGSLENRVMVSARKFKELGIREKKKIKNVKQIEKSPRS